MNEHVVTYYEGKKPGTHIAVCACRAQSSQLDNDACLAWWESHKATALRAKIARQRGRTNLTDQYNWYTEQAADTTKPIPERQQWQMLADELGKRLGSTEVGDDHLF